MEYEKKYMEYKKMADYHLEKCGHYKHNSKSKYMKHYRYYKYYYVKMTYYAKKCAPNAVHVSPAPEHCESTHTHYKHYYHHHHIDKHHYDC